MNADPTAAACGIYSTTEQASPGRWAAAWCASVQGPYPAGNAGSQPCLDFAFPDPELGARDQTFRLVIKPSIWGRQVRIRLSNVYGKKPLALDGIFIGVQLASAVLMAGSNTSVTFGGVTGLDLAPGEAAWSDPVSLPLVDDPDSTLLRALKLAVSFHVRGESGPMTWHAKAMGTSYITTPGAGSVGHSDTEDAFVFSTTSWFFLDALDVLAPASTQVVAAIGDSITDGSASTLNGFDRWPDVLGRKLQALYGNRVSVVNLGIGGNRVVGPAHYTPDAPFPGGPSMVQRVQRDVVGLSGLTTVIWQEGTNDFSATGGASVEEVQAGMADVVARLRQHVPGVRIVGATNHCVLGATHPNHGSAEQEHKRLQLNTFIRSAGLFDAVADFDAATLDPVTGRMRAEFIPDSSNGGPGDWVHPNRAGYMAMADSVRLDDIVRSKAHGS